MSKSNLDKLPMRTELEARAEGHSPLPWELGASVEYATFVNSEDRCVAKCDADHRRIQHKANAAFIVLAANSFDAMKAALEACIELAWEDTRRVVFDDTVLFGKGYNFEGLELLRSEIHSNAWSFMVWPDRLVGEKKWSAYGGPDGAMWFEKFATEQEAKAAVLRELLSLCPDHPAAKAFAALSLARGEKP